MKAYLVTVYKRKYYAYEAYNEEVYFRQVVFNEEQIEIMQNNFDRIEYEELY